MHPSISTHADKIDISTMIIGAFASLSKPVIPNSGNLTLRRSESKTDTNCINAITKVILGSTRADRPAELLPDGNADDGRGRRQTS